MTCLPTHVAAAYHQVPREHCGCCYCEQAIALVASEALDAVDLEGHIHCHSHCLEDHFVDAYHYENETSLVVEVLGGVAAGVAGAILFDNVLGGHIRHPHVCCLTFR